MSIPLSVRQIAHVLQQNVLSHLDLSDLSEENAKPDKSQVLTRALAAVALWEQVPCSIEDAAAAVVDSGADGGMDAIYTTMEPPRLYIVQSKWRQKGNATLNQEATLKLANGFKKLVDNNPGDFNPRIKAKWNDIQRVLLNPNSRVIMIMALLGDEPVHVQQRGELEEIAKQHNIKDRFEFRYLHQRDFLSMARDNLSRNTIDLEINLVESFHRPHTSKQQEAYQGSVLARDVRDWYDRHGERLFDQNVRGWLGNTVVNGKIRRTMQNDPELFWYLNKGIMMVAHEVSESVAQAPNRGPARLQLKRASIVDGAQTVTTVHRILTDLGTGFAGDAQVPIRVVSLENAPADLADRITIAANTQNAILQRDFAATDPVQEELHLDLDMIGKRYIYKRGGDLSIADADTCRIEDVAIALVCQQGDPRLIARATKNPDSLWERENSGIYNIIFKRAPSGRLVWNAVEFLRHIGAKMDQVAKKRDGRAVAIAEHSTLLVAHCLLRLIDDRIVREASSSEWEDEINRATQRCDEVLNLVIHRLDTQYGHESNPSSTFSNEERTKIIAKLVLADLRSGTDRPELAAKDRARTKAMNAVHYILDNKLIAEGETLFFKSHTKSRRELVDRWLAANPGKGKATWVNHRSRPLLWENEPKSFAPTPLALKLIEEITGTELKSVRGPDCWVTADGRSLTDLAEEAKRRAADG